MCADTGRERQCSAQWRKIHCHVFFFFVAVQVACPPDLEGNPVGMCLGWEGLLCDGQAQCPKGTDEFNVTCEQFDCGKTYRVSTLL